eukprot:CAMPEP_0184738072 /NCGR_PEP_ID=MMETSP0315-20130426/813_1 /TAXON_ID=101924 /ORGANISM="Rhodosorus marinus, Strain UTEX LB 2760" /LENGTH=238 /DNA_ID=CAMNT_0027205629 /DNA_START=89 /DNA_END=802 /DNA_ORIENTATION=-
MDSAGVLSSMPSIVAASVVAVGYGVEVLDTTVQGISYACTILCFGLAAAMKTSRQAYTLMAVGLVPTLAILGYDCLVVFKYGDLGAALVGFFSLMGAIVAVSWLHQNFASDVPQSNEWVPIRPGAVAGLKLQNSRNKVISDRLTRRKIQMEAEKSNCEMKFSQFEAEFAETKAVLERLSTGEQGTSSQEMKTVCEHYMELLDINIEETKASIESKNKDIEAVQTDIDNHAQTDFNLIW